jgi:hypothetical protein
MNMKPWWKVAVSVALVIGVVALMDVVQDYRRSGALNWGHAAISLGIPAACYAAALVFGRRGRDRSRR